MKIKSPRIKFPLCSTVDVMTISVVSVNFQLKTPTNGSPGC